MHEMNVVVRTIAMVSTLGKVDEKFDLTLVALNCRNPQVQRTRDSPGTGKFLSFVTCE